MLELEALLISLVEQVASAANVSVESAFRLWASSKALFASLASASGSMATMSGLLHLLL